MPVKLLVSQGHGPGRRVSRVPRSRVHTPVASLHETRINGRNVGICLGRSALNEERSAGREPYVVFGRSVSGDLVLRGYVVPDGDRMRAFRMNRPN